MFTTIGRAPGAGITARNRLNRIKLAASRLEILHKDFVKYYLDLPGPPAHQEAGHPYFVGVFTPLALLELGGTSPQRLAGWDARNHIQPRPEPASLGFG